MEVIRDIAVQMRDGVKLYVDLFRAEGSTNDRLPTLMTMSPYGKHGLESFDLFPGSGVPRGSVSRHAVWEGPGPLYWTRRGYAVLNVDGRGSWASEGDLVVLGLQEAIDGYDVIERAAM